MTLSESYVAGLYLYVYKTMPSGLYILKFLNIKRLWEWWEGYLHIFF